MSSAVLEYFVSLLVHPSQAQTSEILWKTLRIHDLEHSEGGVYASFMWDLCSDQDMTKSSMPKAWHHASDIYKICFSFTEQGCL